MRAPWLISCLLLGGCGLSGTLISSAANVVSVPLFGRTVPDILVSAVTSKDCSSVHVDAGRPYCTEEQAPPAPPPFCTRSLGVVDCWTAADQQLLPRRPGVADGPARLTAAQEADRTKGWPGLFRSTPSPGPGGGS